MAECKDCIHYCVCSPYTAPNESYPETDGCKLFKANADVVPRSESEFDSIPVEVSQVLKDKAVEKAKVEVAREIFEEIENIVDKRTAFNCNIYALLLKKDFAELKKKYTEGKT